MLQTSPLLKKEFLIILKESFGKIERFKRKEYDKYLEFWKEFWRPY